MDLSSFKPQDENEILKEIKEKELSENEISSLINLGKRYLDSPCKVAKAK